MSEPRKTVLEASGVTGTVRVEFERVGDYFSHVIWLQTEQDRIPVFRSFEDPSITNVPCFTALHQQDKNLFLTGTNGPCHWSMSVEVGDARLQMPVDSPLAEAFRFNERYGLNAPDRDTRNPSFHFLFFDVACRIKEDVLEMSTLYTKSEAVEYQGESQANSGQLWQIVGHEKAKLAFGANPDHETLRFDPAPKCLLVREQDDLLRISSSESAERKYPATVQWSYGVWA
jgi:hypothetical protein